MGDTNLEDTYLAAREEQERRMAAAAVDRASAELHRQLAEEYAERRRQLLARAPTIAPRIPSIPRARS